MEPADVRFLASLRGAPITILYAMCLLNHPTGPDELATVTGYGPTTVSDRLQQLALHGWVVNARRFQGWVLSAAAQQLPLFGVADLLLPARREINASPPVVGSSDQDHMDLFKPTTNNARRENDSSRRYGDFPAQVRGLAAPIIRAGCDPLRACSVVEAALADGDAPEAVTDYVERWLAYRDAGARGVANWGRLIAKRLEQNAPPPDVQPKLIDVCPACQFAGGEHAANCPRGSALP